MIIHQVRNQSTDEGTISFLYLPGTILRTMEPPWRQNQRKISCIPYGEYECEIVDSPQYGRVYGVKDVPNRTHILFHWGNWAGDESLGLRSNSDGCILVGETVTKIYNQLAVSASRKAVNTLHSLLNDEPFTLILSGYDLW